ncbi:MAG: GGDEF domain-containing protein [Thermoanaerobaculia bacterium]
MFGIESKLLLHPHHPRSVAAGEESREIRDVQPPADPAAGSRDAKDRRRVAVGLFMRRVRLWRLLASVLFASSTIFLANTIFPWLAARLTWSVAVAIEAGLVALLLHISSFPIVRAVRHQIIATHQLTEKFRDEATRDALTDLHNRRFFDDHFAGEFLRARRYNLRLSMILFDLDHFKELNDRYGHPVGDAVLQRFARRLVFGIRRTDIVVRLGGEEFAVILPETGIRGAAAVAEACRQACAITPVRVGRIRALEIPLTVSAGVAEIRNEDANEQQIYARADESLYMAKRIRNRVCAIGIPGYDDDIPMTGGQFAPLDDLVARAG